MLYERGLFERARRDARKIGCVGAYLCKPSGDRLARRQAPGLEAIGPSERAREPLAFPLVKRCQGEEAFRSPKLVRRICVSPIRVLIMDNRLDEPDAHHYHFQHEPPRNPDEVCAEIVADAERQGSDSPSGGRERAPALLLTRRPVIQWLLFAISRQKRPASNRPSMTGSLLRNILENRVPKRNFLLLPSALRPTKLPCNPKLGLFPMQQF